MDPEAVRRTLEPTATPEDISGSTPYDSFVISGVRLDAAEHGRVLCSFVVTPRHASPQGYLLSGVTATLADQMGSAVIYSIGVGPSGVSLEISVSYVDTATVGEEIEVEGKMLRAGKSVCVISIDFRKKRTGKLIAQMISLIDYSSCLELHNHRKRSKPFKFPYPVPASQTKSQEFLAATPSVP